MNKPLQLALAGLTLVTSLAGVVATDAAPARAVGFEGTTVTVPSGNTQTLGKSVTVVASTTYAIDNTGFYLQLYAMDTGERLCASDGSPGVAPQCTATVWNTKTSAHTRKFVAYVTWLVDRIPASDVILSSSRPTWITWSNLGYTIRQERWFEHVIAVTNKPIDGFAIIEIHHAVTEQLLTYCLSGSTCVVKTAEPTVAFVVPWDIAASSNTLG
ncbi:hypothetical protein [Phytohabitans aurantiacus]|uniref:Secreted protein n=1 Tax=Phytohabitans aurantiacus TaxID=3016789 RepID=A0ABQ5QM26_9ACTN|nr:hypothetical protein [Phytohabitans aurantiacus]GLH95297.1 hypothetical protein Pa4123_05690 [Phytohabitans aurantiacus]